MRGPRAFGSPPPMSSHHRNLEPLGGGTRQYISICTVAWWPISVGGLEFEYASSPCKPNGNNFFVPEKDLKFTKKLFPRRDPT